MIIEPMIVTDKIGRSIVLRNAEEDDAASLIKFMKITTGETSFLIREPDKFSAKKNAPGKVFSSTVAININAFGLSFYKRTKG